MSSAMASDMKTEGEKTGEPADSGAQPPATGPKAAAAQERLRRRAEALRGNLRRRKDQSRGRKAGHAPGNANLEP